MNTAQLRVIDALVAEHIMGKRFWLETRGEYTLAVGELNGGREPWKGTQLAYQQPERYKQCTAIEAVKAGFFGDSFVILPRYTKDISAAFDVMQEIAKDEVLVMKFVLAFGRSRDTRKHPGTFDGAECWAFAFMSPLERCLAALAAKGIDTDAAIKEIK